MSYQFDSRLGEQLYRLLPEVYRTRDRVLSKSSLHSGDESLAKYLDAHGSLLDMIHATMEQQLKDTLPDSSQDWLLSYFAQLLAVNIVSPDSEGRHAEISHAIEWRQRKGTLKCIEEIAEAVAQLEIEIHEGWKRIAVTPRIGMPLMPAKVWDSALNIDMNNSSEAKRHPTLPAVMVDMRRPSRAVEAQENNPAARNTNFGGVRQNWRQLNHHGAPCFPNSYEDVSRRTVDFRTPGINQGHYHHKRVLAFAPPQYGFFSLDTIYITWAERQLELYEHLFEEGVEHGVIVIHNRSERTIVITDDVTLTAASYYIEGIEFQGVVTVPSGGALTLSKVIAKKVIVDTFSTNEFVLTASDSLFNELSSAGMISLDSCTILGTAALTSLVANDCIIMNMSGHEITGVITYSRIPENAPLHVDDTKLSIKSHLLLPNGKFQHIHEAPGFIAGQTVLRARAVLSPLAPYTIYTGASDGGEMGYYHHGRKNGPVTIQGDSSGELSLHAPADGAYPLQDIIFDCDVTFTTGQLILFRTVARKLTIDTAINLSGVAIPTLIATDCLFKSLYVENGLARLEYCTVMEVINSKHLQASDCIFAGTVVNVSKPVTDKTAPAFLNCVRYSCLPTNLSNDVINALRLTITGNFKRAGNNTLEVPAFSEFDYCVAGALDHRSAVFGNAGYGVLDSVTSNSIRFGAEDGGEMGAYHHKFYSLKSIAMLDKMREFLPVGIEPVLIQDARLLHVPPQLA